MRRGDELDPPLTEEEIAAGAAFLAKLILAHLARYPTYAEFAAALRTLDAPEPRRIRRKARGTREGSQ